MSSRSCLSCLSLLLLLGYVSSYITNPSVGNLVTSRTRLGALHPSSEVGYIVEVADESDLEPAANLCVDIFFGQAGLNPFRSSHLTRLQREQYSDLAGKFGDGATSFFKVAHDGHLIGFAELTVSKTIKYLGAGIPDADARPLLANLAVAESWRCRGVGSKLVDTCEAEAQRLGFAEVVLQVEEDNERARTFYAARDYDELFCDRAARRYDASGIFLQNVRTSRLTLRKTLISTAPADGKLDVGLGEMARSWFAELGSALGRFQGPDKNK
mmetsp:Transcript_57535/g.130367  ORF Transcript_57535/g.130367 Transcript_57535/m.130367 type:complete len:270 (-) Transcript_57535:235-1044(-)|eukprot:CAMPEP_0172586352 /NCGR_PEP_ID=MMETSP1068-20121228/5725_1 /TAXON_ID=35684 /ORGANISM="Pseudopedinella elastica, Strain CCMP716" /LENGTH=269 /DNA_ID=CAMNT_0013381127 /DNA_START=96 /DNA_END=905 /DNA_ORIENTATION=+